MTKVHAQLTDPLVAKCIDRISKSGATFFFKLNKYSNLCESKRDAGKIPADSNCNTNFSSDDLTVWPTFAQWVEKARAGLTEKVDKSCNGHVVDASFDMPCGTFDGVMDSQQLASCVILYAHGRSASSTQVIVNANGEEGGCRPAMLKAASEYVRDYLKAYRACGKKQARGKQCDSTLLFSKISEARAKHESEALKVCGNNQSIHLGGVCSGAYTNIGQAIQCLLDNSESEAINLVKMIYDFDFLPE